MDAQARRRRRLLAAAKLALAATIIGWLVYQLRGQALFSRLLHEPKRWDALLIAQILVIAAFANNILRWFVLVRTLGLQFRLADAFRLGSFGFLMNQVAPGSVGGDLFKAAFVAREQPKRRTEAIATIVVDRVVGVYAMILVASCGRFVAAGDGSSDGALQTLSSLVSLCAVVGTLGLMAFLWLPVDARRVRNQVARTPLVGGTLARLVDASSVYRDRPGPLLGTIVMSIGSHVLLVLAFWMLARGLPVHAPTLAEMTLVGPMALVAGALPLTPSGLGTLEAALNHLFVAVGAPEGDGFLTALAYRATTYGAAAVGAVYYLTAPGPRIVLDDEAA